jgi:hypothetical protein
MASIFQLAYVGVLPLMIEKVPRSCPIRRHLQVDMHLGVFKCFSREADIAGTIFEQKDFE